MTRYIGTLLAVCVMAGACVMPEPAPPAPVEVQLFNPTQLDVRPNLHVSPSGAGDLFDPANRVAEFTDRPFQELRPGEALTLTFDCESIAAVGVDQPVLFNAATLSSTTSADRVMAARDGQYACGDRVRFVFFTDGGEFRVRVEVE